MLGSLSLISNYIKYTEQLYISRATTTITTTDIFQQLAFFKIIAHRTKVTITANSLFKTLTYALQILNDN
ncbi:hypothetical protein ACSS6W_007038 [Trichoderma asperelloides]